MLAAYNVCAEEVKGEINGKPYQGIVYSATNDKGEKGRQPCASQGSVLIVPLARIRQVFFENDLSSPTYLSNERRQGV